MDTKSLLYGLIGFFIGGLLVSVAATTFEKPEAADEHADSVGMSEMTERLRPLKGDEYDKEFIAQMIDHHQAAVDMARQSADRAQHQEIKDLSLAIIATQDKEIYDMLKWQKDWGYLPKEGHGAEMVH